MNTANTIIGVVITILLAMMAVKLTANNRELNQSMRDYQSCTDAAASVAVYTLSEQLRECEKKHLRK